jgi:hypothetical protein
MIQITTCADSELLSQSICLLKMEIIWIRNPFNSTAPDFSSNDKEQWIELTCNGNLKLKFYSDHLISFLDKSTKQFPRCQTKLSLQSCPSLPPAYSKPDFPATYPPKKFRSKLELGPNMCIYLPVSRLISSVFGQAIRLLHHIRFGKMEAVTVMPSCSGGGNVVVAWSSSL